MLAVDVGTSGVRAAVVDTLGRIVAMSRVARRGADERAFDAELMWQEVSQAVRGLDVGARAAVQAVGIAAFIGSVFVDREGAPVGPGLGWADDSGVDRYAQAMGEDLPVALRAAGRPVVGGGAGPGAVALRARDPDAFARVIKILTPKDYLLHRLTGEAVTDHTTAAYSMCSDVRMRRWSADILGALELSIDLFPTPFHAGAGIGVVIAEAARAWGVASGTPVVAGGPDGSMGAFAVAAGARAFPDPIVDIAGTTDVLVKVRHTSTDAPATAVLNPGIRPGEWTVGGSTGMTGGAVASWARRFAGTDPEGEGGLLVDALATPTDPRTLLMGPYFSGSRFPRWRRDEREWVEGPSDASGVEIVRAALEGSAYAVREGVDLLDPDRRSTILLAGGSARSAAGAQLRADVFGRPVATTSQPDATLLAAAQLAAEHVGRWDRPADGLRLHRPDPARVADYDAAFARWRSLADRYLQIG